MFEQVVVLLAEEGLLSIEEIYTGGTKIEAKADRYTFVWKKLSESIRKRCKRSSPDGHYLQSINDAEDNMPNSLI